MQSTTGKQEEQMRPSGKTEHPGGESRQSSGSAAMDPRGIERLTRDELYERARQMNIPGRSKMTKDQLGEAVRAALGTH